MRERHECHCMLFLTEENEFAGDSQKLSVEEARRRRADWAGLRGWAFRDARERAHTPPPPSACARRWRGVVPPAFGALTALTSAAPRAPAARRWCRTQRTWGRYCDSESAPLLGSLPPRALTQRSPWLSAVRGCPRALAREGLLLCDPSRSTQGNRRTDKSLSKPRWRARATACVLSTFPLIVRRSQCLVFCYSVIGDSADADVRRARHESSTNSLLTVGPAPWGCCCCVLVRWCGAHRDLDVL